jgi:hypothetical protein
MQLRALQFYERDAERSHYSAQRPIFDTQLVPTPLPFLRIINEEKTKDGFYLPARG